MDMEEIVEERLEASEEASGDTQYLN